MQHGRKVVAPQPLGNPSDPFFVSVEFAAACYRFGHSMVRDSYSGWSLGESNAELDALLYYTFTGGPNGLAFKRMPDRWLQDWQNFLDAQGTDAPTRTAPIDLSLAEAEFRLPARLFAKKAGEVLPDEVGLPERTLRRGIGLGLPSAQQLQAEIQSKSGLLIPLLQDIANSKGEDPPPGMPSEFLGATPLWLYTLWEAGAAGGRTLGPLAGRVVMETIHAAIENSPVSILQRLADGSLEVRFEKVIGDPDLPDDEMTLREVRDAAML
jgi:hypothetical protein